MRVTAKNREDALARIAALGEVVGDVRLVQASEEHDLIERPQRPLTSEIHESSLLSVHPAFLRGQPGIALVAILTIPLFGLGLLVLALHGLACIVTRFEVTNHRSILMRGLIVRQSSEVRHADIRHVVTSQSLLQRIFGTGNLALSSAGSSGHEIVVVGIDRMGEIKTLIESKRRTP